MLAIVSRPSTDRLRITSPVNSMTCPVPPAAPFAGTLLGDEPTPDAVADAPATSAHAPSVPEPGTPAGLGDPANHDTAGGGGFDAHDEDGGEG